MKYLLTLFFISAFICKVFSQEQQTLQNKQKKVDELWQNYQSKFSTLQGGVFNNPDAIDLIKKIHKNCVFEYQIIPTEWKEENVRYLYTNDGYGFFECTDFIEQDINSNMKKSNGDPYDSMTIYKLYPMGLMIPRSIDFSYAFQPRLKIINIPKRKYCN